MTPLFQEISPFTPLMLEALRKVYEMQSKNKPFAQIDINGSFAGLLRRKLVEAKTIMVEGELFVTWYVTDAGELALIKEGFID